MAKKKKQGLEDDGTEIMTLVLKDGTELPGTAKQIMNFLKVMINEPKPKKSTPYIFPFCPTLDVDEEGYAKTYQGTFDNTHIIEKWYSSKKCPKCKKEHEFPIVLKIRSGKIR
jgi:hypothetical protein